MPKLYAKKETVRKYYKYVDIPWTQPILTSNGTLGGDSFAVQSLPTDAVLYPAYQAFDGLTTTGNGWAGISNSSYVMYSPVPIKITNINVLNYSWVIGKYSVLVSDDNSNWVTIKNGENTDRTSGHSWDIPLNPEREYKYYKIASVNAIAGSRAGAREFTITATQREIVQGTEDDYDFYEDIGVWSVPKKTVTKYWKYVDTPWVQPVITSNGTLGGDSFAVSAEKEYLDFYAYKAFISYGWCSTSGTTENYVFYNPIPLKIAQLKITGFNGRYIRNYDFYGSNDGTSWHLIGNYTVGAVTEVTNNINSTVAYKYHKLAILSCSTNPMITNFKIIATQQSVEPSTPDDYDFTTEQEVYYGSMQGGN